MKTIDTPPPADVPSTWNPEDLELWRASGSRLGWRTLWVTTFCLILAFATWFMVSAIAVRLPGIGFKFDTQQLFWIAAMPGLAAGTLRIIHTFLIPILGTRLTVAVSTLLLVIPCIGWGIAVQNPDTSYGTFLFLGFLAGLGGGNFSSFMPSTSLFFPKRLQGTALGYQAGIGNFGVSVAQFTVPWIIGFAMFGSLLGGSQTLVKDGVSKQIWLQNAAYVWAPFCLVGAVLAWIMLRSVPVKATFREQTDIFKNKHTWLMTSLYMMTFGSFSGYAAAFPLLIKKVYGDFPNAPDPLKYAFLGPLVGAGVRAAFGPISDKLGGARVTMWSSIGLLGCALWVTLYTDPTSTASFGMFVWAMLGLFFFSGVGNASTFKQMPMIFPPRQAGGVIGWTSAIAAYGPFIFSVAFGAIIARTGSPTSFFYGAAAFYAVNLVINWWFYARKGCEAPC
ncbi:MAG: NarK/NasA family nitrate transporter [Fimbriimonadaceae bacterium]|nr:NarK/NasA family nitrate transporter [Chthonomonadaceae bacterium]MCO5297457.1 NarK/NasA family nitrate transporter [Fimbriimonadaceae bacterium]